MRTGFRDGLPTTRSGFRQEIEADGCRATVLKRRGRRVTLVRFEVLKRPTAASDEELMEETDAAVERTEEDDA